ncbi:MAG: hypothetical protein M1834_001921 [Cirrosporium novae-zelandiae]|nr:MAG: hypothetical protein M1834_001921 [Cirrosporium novae-zelandiae]
MASTATAASAVNNTTSGNKAFNTNANSVRSANNKSAAGSKIIDSGRRQANSPVEGTQRRSNPPKAWTQGTNPITQRPTNSLQQNGVPSTNNKNAETVKSMGQKEMNTFDKPLLDHLHDRMLYLLGHLVGTTITVEVKNGDKFAGIFSTAEMGAAENSIMLKMVQKILGTGVEQPNGGTAGSGEYIGHGPDHAMSFKTKDVIRFWSDTVDLAEQPNKSQNGVSSTFKTDTDISGNTVSRERPLQRWQPSSTADVDMSLESADHGEWDQFEANERLYGLRSDYDENLYTTSIDRSDPRYKQKLADAERIAKEIEGSQTTNVHIREERGLAAADDSGLNEEDKYSGVRRNDVDFPPLQSGQPNKYTPPARRPPTGQPTVAGAPVDPAIISSQLAKPKSTPKAPQQVSTPPVPQNQKGKLNTDISADKLNASAAPAKPLIPGKVLGGNEQKRPSRKISPAPNVAATGSGENEKIETQVHAAFKQFASNEKWKFEESRRRHASHDKAVKLNDLMKFSQNFKLSTPVPKDLIPILAKDKAKQEQIIAKANQQMEEVAKSTTVHTTPKSSVPTDPKSHVAATGRYDVAATSAINTPERGTFPRNQRYPPSGPMNSQPMRNDRNMQSMNFHQPRNGTGTGMLGHRLADIQQQRKAGIPSAVPAPLPIHDGRVPTGAAFDHHSGVSSPRRQSGVPTPTSAVSTKFNAKAMEFKPNPNANAFTPTGNPSVTSSPRSNSHARTVSRAQTPSAFFGDKKPIPTFDRPSLDGNFNPIKRMKKDGEKDEATAKAYAANGGIPQAYRTPPTWEVSEQNQDKKYTDFFEKVPYQGQAASPQYRSATSAQLPHQHQLPLHLQQGAPVIPQLQTPQATYQHLQPQPPNLGGPQHFDDHHRMQISSSNSSVYPSPRLQNSNMAYTPGMGPHPQLAYGQGMPQYVMGATGPQPAHMGQYPGGPQYMSVQGAPMAPMMMHQNSAGPYLNMPQPMGVPIAPQMPAFSPRPGFVHPQHVPPQPHSGYPSPRGAPMMMHQGSQQGQHQPMMFMGPGAQGQPMYAVQQPGHMPPMRGGYQPHFSSSPRQTHHYPPQPHRAPSSSSGQVPQQPPPHMYQQAPPPNPTMVPASDGAADEGK